MTTFRYTVTEKDEGLAVKSIIKQAFGFSSRMMIKFKQNESLRLNGESVPGWVRPKAGDLIEIDLPEERSDFEPEDIPLEVVFEDEYLLIINKQPGYVVHPTMGQPRHTMANAIMHYMQTAGQSFKIRFVNRLDRDTSGLLIVAKNAYVQEDLTKQMKRNEVHKRYEALVCGMLESDEGTVNVPIGRENPDLVERGVLAEELGGSPSVTHYKVLERIEGEHIRLFKSVTNGLSPLGENTGFDREDLERLYASLGDKEISDLTEQGRAGICSGMTRVELLLETGRTHQIRVHMGYLGNNVVGDTLYGGVLGDMQKDAGSGARFTPLIDRQALHAKSLEFIHPVTRQQVRFDAPLPQDMIKIIKN